MALIRTGPESLPLWKDSMPFSLGSGDKDIPKLVPFLPKKTASRTPAVMVCPGGGYAMRVDDCEGTHIAAWFQEKGWTAFVLKYRLPTDGYRHPVPLLDAQRAIRLIRFRSAEWNIDPAKIGVMGFSAGGHLAATLDTHFDAGHPEAPELVDRVSCRPDFAVLVYPVISMQDGVTHLGSRENLLGPDPDPALIESLSNERQVTAQTPPTLLISSPADEIVPIRHSELMIDALEKAGVSNAHHVYEGKPHGWAGRIPDIGPPGWLDSVAGWLASQGFAASL